MTSAPGSCAWPTIDSAATSNFAAVDVAAEYWLQTVVVQPNLKVVLDGTYPDARYASFGVYLSDGSSFTSNGVGSSLPDYKIAPESGSINPWQKAAKPGGKYAITLREDVAPGETNTLPLAPAGTPGGTLAYLEYRVYLPAGVSNVGPPTVTLEQGKDSTTLAVCRNPKAISASALAPVERAIAAKAATTTTVTPTTTKAKLGPLQFVRGLSGGLGELFPNPDTSYVLAYFTPSKPGDVVVLTARAPTTPVGDHPSPWPQAGEDMRYWSMCIYPDVGSVPVVENTLPGGKVDWGCRADDATTVSSSGDYTYVIGTEAQRAAIERIPGVTFLPLSSSAPSTRYLLILRNTLVSSSFANSVQHAPTDSAAGAAAAMGPYYPRASVCALSAKGLSACHAQS